MTTVYSLLSKRAARTPDDIIAEWQDDNTTNGAAPQLLKCCPAYARWPGPVGTWRQSRHHGADLPPTCYEWGVADFACAAIGAVVVPVYETGFRPSDRGHRREVDPAIAFLPATSSAQTLEQIRVNHPGMKYVFNFKADGLDAVVDFGHGVSDETLDADYRSYQKPK